MPRRRLPPEILSYLGPCAEPETASEKVLEQCALAKLMGDSRLVDYDPLIVVMHLVAEEVQDVGLSPNGPKGGQAWLEVMTELQKNAALNHNTRLPCRYCDQAFQPVVDKQLLKLFWNWQKSRKAADCLAIHRCPECGSALRAVGPLVTYAGDGCTPEPIWTGSDEAWVEQLLLRSGLQYR